MTLFSWLNKKRIKKVQKIEKQEIMSVSITAVRKLSIDEIAVQLSSLSFTNISKDSNKLIVEITESEDYKKTPYLFTRITFSANAIDIVYSITPETTEKLRLLETSKLLLCILTLTKSYATDPDSLFAFIYSGLESASELITQECIILLSKLDMLKTENAKITKKCHELFTTNEKIDKLLLEKGKSEQALTEKLEKLERISDETLNEEIYHWIALHNGEISINEFSKFYNIPSSRIEKSLDFLLKNGYLLRLGDNNGT